jgi:hypothetical protein
VSEDSTADAPGPAQDPAPDDREAIDAERRRRLDPANRPDGAEVDNTDATLPTLEAWQAEQPDEPTPGRSDPSQAFREQEVSEEEKAEIAAERERRLDPANRPEGAEVDNTGRRRDDD